MSNKSELDTINLSQFSKTNIIKSFDYVPTEADIRKQLSDKLEKGILTKEIHDKAVEQLNNLIKAKGEGSRGGKIIGHTKSGKPVYQTKGASHEESYGKFTAQDHKDAANLHNEEAYTHDAHRMHASPIMRSHHGVMGQHHSHVANRHEILSEQLSKKEHESKLSDDEKKIIADQKKKQIDHHEKMKDAHDGIVQHLKSKYGKDEDSSHINDILSHHIQQREHHREEIHKKLKE